MSLELFVYADNPITELTGSVNFLAVVAANRQEADAIIAEAVYNSRLTNYPQAGGTVQKFEYLNSTFNKVATLADLDALNKGPGYPVCMPGVVCEFQSTVAV